MKFPTQSPASKALHRRGGTCTGAAYRVPADAVNAAVRHPQLAQGACSSRNGSTGRATRQAACGGPPICTRHHPSQRQAPLRRRGPPAAAASPEGSNAGSPPHGAPGSSSGAGASGRGVANLLHSGSGASAVRLVELPGRGRGVVATRNLVPGELLLLCRPLALVRGPPQQAAPEQAQQQQAPQQQQQQPQQQQPPEQQAQGQAAPRGGQPAPGGAARRAAGGAPAAAAAAATAAAACSEGALVAELQRLPWGPRQADILAKLFRGVERAQPAGRQPSRRQAPNSGAAAAVRRPVGEAGGLTLPTLSDLVDPWDVDRHGGGSGADAGGGCLTPDSASSMTAPAATAPAAVASPAAAVPASGAAATRGSSPGLSPEQLAAVVRLNATGLPTDDVLLAQLYGGQNAPYIGLWPGHAMINHSCTPNAVAVVSGDLLAVRCCAPVPAGGEVCITYAGALGLGPLPLRRALLERNHRFKCACARCQAEERVPRELSQLWIDIITLNSQQQPRLMAAAVALKEGAGSSSGGGSSAAAVGVDPHVLQQLLDVRSQVAKCWGLFEETLAQLRPSPQEALWMQASMYSLYETRARCAQLLSTAAASAASAAASEPSSAAAASTGTDQGVAAAEAAAEAAASRDPRKADERREGEEGGAEEMARRLWEEYLEALSACVRLQGVANAGSDMHMQIAARYDAACAAYAARHPGARGQLLAAEAAQRLERALVARYGAAAAAAAPTTPSSAPAGAAEAAAAAAHWRGAPVPVGDLLRLVRELHEGQHGP